MPKSLIYREPDKVGVPHTHKDEHGILVRCYHSTKTNWKAWIIAGIIWLFGFPLEHFLWEQVPPFNNIANTLGIGVGHDEQK